MLAAKSCPLLVSGFAPTALSLATRPSAALAAAVTFRARMLAFGCNILGELRQTHEERRAPSECQPSGSYHQRKLVEREAVHRSYSSSVQQ
jgi:hypothetical protein